ncbi:MAG: S8 family serine peptidase, partial [Elusimicrobia bacterium]|nr:S8 family serine peptidase [Elusimicrobiota bacterium]
VGNAANAAAQRTWNAARDMAVPMLIEALKDPVWLVRFYAAMSLYNMRSPSAAIELSKLAVSDPDGRVRQAAFLALGNTPSYAADQLLAQAAQEIRADRADVAIYAAYALARHGDSKYVSRIVQETSSSDKMIRFTAAWLLGELGGKAGTAGADALAYRVRDLKERGNIRHLSSAALGEVANSDPTAISNEAIVALLDSSGAQDMALTRTISKFFSAVSRKRTLVERMRAEPLKPRVMDFILANKAWVGRPGALGEMVTLLARIANVPLDVPSPAPDPMGTGVPGVDPNIGPVHLIVEAPKSLRIQKFEDLRGLPAKAVSEAAVGHGLDPQTLERHEAQVQAAMPLSQSFWINVPESKIAAFTADFEAKGYKVHRAQPKYRMIHDTAKLSGATEMREKLGLTGKGVLVVYLDEGGDLSHPGLAKDRIGPVRNFSGEGSADDVTQESIGHGTHGMGIVGATKVEGSPYEGMATEAKFAVGKVLGANGGSDAMVMAGLEWALSLVDPLKTPVVVNMSLGGPGEPDSPLSKLVNMLQLKDVAVVAAAGNEGPQEGTIGSPGNAALAFRVGAVDKKGKLTFYSSRDNPGAKPLFFWLHYGGAVDFDLPNPYEIISTLATNLAEKLKDAASTVKWQDKALYQAMSGTSMATPHVTGQLAQLAQRMAEVMLKDGGSLPHGYWLYLGRLVNNTLQKMPDLKSHEGAGLFDARAAANALEAALKDPARVRAESEALAKDAEAKFGAGKASRGGFWLRAAGRAVKRLLSPTMTGFTFPSGRLAEPVEKLLSGRDPPKSSLNRRAELRAVLGDGPSGWGPFHFRGGMTAYKPGLEGFLHAKLGVGREDSAAQLDQYFKYLDGLLEAPQWAQERAELARLRDLRLRPDQLDERLDAHLIEFVNRLRAELKANDPSQDARHEGIYMVLARAFQKDKNVFDALDDAELDRIKVDSQADTLWLLDVFEIGKLKRWGVAGGSPYAIRGYKVKEEHGGDAAFKAFVARAHKKGLKVMVDYIPNHYSLDSYLFDAHPDAFIHMTPPQPTEEERKDAAKLEAYKKRILSESPRSREGLPLYELLESKTAGFVLVHHPFEGSYEGGYMWNDMAQIDYSQPSARAWQTAEASRLFSELGVDGIRRDMSYFVTAERFYPHWLGLLSFERDRLAVAPWAKEALKQIVAGLAARRDALKGAEFLAEMDRAIRETNPAAQIIDEAYDNLTALSRAGSGALYNKNGLYDAIVSGDAGRIRATLREVAFAQWQRGSAGLVNFPANHDANEGNPVDKFGYKAEAVMANTLMFQPTLFYNGLELMTGRDSMLIRDGSSSEDDGRPSSNQKMIPFDAKAWIDWSKGNPSRRAFLRRVVAAGKRNRDLFRDGVMESLEPTGGAGETTAWLAGKGSRALLVAANWGSSRDTRWTDFKLDASGLSALGGFKPKADRMYVLRDYAQVAPDGGPVVLPARSGADLAHGLSIGLTGGGVQIFEIEELPE